ncbi:hypothetical protein AZE42_02582 [Rhizopogon vesiculosus]|uniref:Uncharacterized protein n=1 Tax=Rhizopogon vesiculosus TaxID=180088 RepID=A0A1J8Q640_9AGAM|nr:hypothetical protein AZE42_02582 [Rhizopogon vesiculosus]
MDPEGDLTLNMVRKVQILDFDVLAEAFKDACTKAVKFAGSCTKSKL